MTPAATRQADECKRLAAGVRIAITRQCIDPSARNVARCDLADGALEAAIDKLASMIPAGGLAEEARWQSMDTAPKVVGRIIGAVEGRARFICWGKTSHVPLYGWILTDQGPEDADLCQPTAWMPLPDAAMASSTTQGKETL